MATHDISIFSTCPQSKHEKPQDYLRRVATVAQWSERYGCRGILVYTDNGLVDPWLVSQHILQNTSAICPLVAVQPVYMHPYTAAKMVASMAHMHGRRLYLNMLAGGFKNDLIALKYYNIHNLKMTPPLDPQLFPGIMMSGSSVAGAEAAAAVEAIAVKYPQRANDEQPMAETMAGPSGVRVGIIARDTTEEAWQVAHERFPTDRKGQVLHRVAMNVSDSLWHKQLSDMARESAEQDDPYWLGPFENYRTFCPYLVGSYERVAQELRRYIELGHDNFILDIPPSEDELLHINIVFQEAATGGLIATDGN